MRQILEQRIAVQRGSPPPRMAALAAAILLAGCASAPAPTAQLQAAAQAIATAERVEAGQYAAGELSEARTKLASANKAVQAEKMEQAARLAAEARVDAELSTARTAAVKAQTVNEEMKRSTDALIQEMQRRPGGTP